MSQAAESGFIDEVKQLIEKQKETIEAASKAAAAGEVNRGNELLLRLTEELDTPAAHFFIGNMLFRIDREASYRLHKKAYEGKPTEPEIILEWAMERHRKGEHQAASDLYQQYLDRVPDERMHALRADCLLRQGKLTDAVNAWQAANHGRHHTAIDFAIHEIYGELSPVRRRGDLLAKIRAGDHNAIEDLILLDVHYDNDWWNADVNERALDDDMIIAVEKFGRESARSQALVCYAELKRADESNGAAVRAALDKAGFIVGSPGTLPVNSKVARALIELAIAAKAESITNLLQRHQKELMARAKSTAGDPDALHALCLLASKTKDGRLAEFARYGWERFGDTKFAASFLVEAAAKGTLKPDDKDLKAALAKAPEDNVLNSLRLQAFKAAGVEPDEAAIVSAIKSEYRQLSFGLVVPDSYTLKGLFAMLDGRLKASPKP